MEIATLEYRLQTIIDRSMLSNWTICMVTLVDICERGSIIRIKASS